MPMTDPKLSVTEVIAGAFGGVVSVITTGVPLEGGGVGSEPIGAKDVPFLKVIPFKSSMNKYGL
jgi:hypothetical protein